MPRFCAKFLLLVAWTTLSQALIMTWPPANAKLAISYPFQISWNLTSGPPKGSLDVFLLTSASIYTQVAVVDSGLADNSQIAFVTVRPPIPPGTYYLYLNDTNMMEGTALGGPYYFTNSLTAPANSTSTSSSGSSFPLWMIPIIILIIIIKVASIFFLLARLGCLGKYGERFRRRQRDPVVYQTQYVIYQADPPGHQSQYQHEYQLQPHLQPQYQPQYQSQYIVQQPSPPLAYHKDTPYY